MTPYWISLDLATDLLLAAAGLAVAAAGFYYLVKKLRDGQKRAEVSAGPEVLTEVRTKHYTTSLGETRRKTAARDLLVLVLDVIPVV